MNNYCFILASSDDRLHHLLRCIKCIKNTKYARADVYLYYQGVEHFPEEAFFKAVVRDTSLRGVFTPRYELMKQFSLFYEYTIIIDDDLFMYPYTDYDNSMEFLKFATNVGAISLGRQFNKITGIIRQIDYRKEEFNINGGLVLPRRAVKVILEYFRDKEADYTEDVFWLLLYVKGYDLFRDFSSNASHTCNQKGKNGEITGFRKMRYEKPRLPLLPEYVNERYEYSEMHRRMLYVTPEVKDVNNLGISERERCMRNV